MPRPAPRLSALIVGGVSWNRIIRVPKLPDGRPQTVFAQRCIDGIGATGAGKALNLARLGWQVTLHSLLGDDEAGAKVRAALAPVPGLRLLAEADPAGTEQHTNVISDAGERLSIYTHCGSFAPQFDLAGLLVEAAQHELVIVNLTNYARALLAPLKARGQPVWCDVHNWNGHDDFHADFIAAADFLFLSSDNLPNWRDTVSALMAGGGKQLVVCTHGAEGATALLPDGRWFDVPALPVHAIVNSDGAGDAFMAGVLHGLQAGRPLEQCLRFGALAGALCVQSPGLASAQLAPPDWASLAAHPGPARDPQD